MEKEVAGTGLESKLTRIRAFCGRRIRTFDTISDLEGVTEIKKAVPYAQESGTMRADILDEFRISMNALIKACENCFSNPVADFSEMRQRLVETHDQEDSFLSLLNKKQFDGIYELASDPAKKKQYRQIQESYFDDRAAIVDSVYRKLLEQRTALPTPKNPRFLYGMAIANTVLLAALAFGVIGTAVHAVSQFRKEKQSLEQGIEMKERAYIYQFYEFADKADPPKDEEDRKKKRNTPLAERLEQVLQVYEKRLIDQGETRYQANAAGEREQWKKDILKMLKEGKLDEAIDGYLQRKMQGK